MNYSNIYSDNSGWFGFNRFSTIFRVYIPAAWCSCGTASTKPVFSKKWLLSHLLHLVAFYGMVIPLLLCRPRQQSRQAGSTLAVILGREPHGASNSCKLQWIYVAQWKNEYFRNVMSKYLSVNRHFFLTSRWLVCLIRKPYHFPVQ